jgi:diguanylate cyclase (GGDEF)-like protein
MPLAGVAAIGSMVWLFPRAENLAHILFALPVLFAASQLKAPLATLTTALAVVADGAFLSRMLPLVEAATDVLFVATVLVVMTVLVVASVNNQERLVAALEHQAAVDPLTGLVTRRVLDDALADALTASTTGAGVALLLVDVDNFKAINDTYGHLAGDDALTHVARELERWVRHDDAVIGRLGGDEIAILLPGCTRGDAARRGEQLVERVREGPAKTLDGHSLTMSISIGVAHGAAQATGARDLYAAADIALYQAKSGGRGRAVLAA